MAGAKDVADFTTGKIHGDFHETDMRRRTGPLYALGSGRAKEGRDEGGAGGLRKRPEAGAGNRMKWPDLELKRAERCARLYPTLHGDGASHTLGQPGGL